MRWGYSKVVLRDIRIVEARVRFPVSPKVKVMYGIKKSPRSGPAVAGLTPELGWQLLAGAAALLLGVPRRGAAAAPVVRGPGLVADTGILRVEVPPAAHLAATRVKLMVGARDHGCLVRHGQYRHSSQLLPDLHLCPPKGDFTSYAHIITNNANFVKCVWISFLDKTSFNIL